MSKSKSRRNQHAKAYHLESLEQRKMLTTLVGGDSFDFYDVLNQHIRVSVSGDAIVELIGARANTSSVLALGDMPGQWLGSNSSLIGRAGTSYLNQGNQSLGDVITITDPVDNNNQTPPIASPTHANASLPASNREEDDLVLQALAVRQSDGAVYGVRVATAAITRDATTGDETIVQVFKFVNNTVNGIGVPDGSAVAVADIIGMIPDDDGKSTVDAVTGAAFDPITGLLYFVASSGTGDDDSDQIFAIDVNAGLGEATPVLAEQAVLATLTTSQAGFDGGTVHGLAFDRTSLSTSRLLVLEDDMVTAMAVGAGTLTLAGSLAVEGATGLTGLTIMRDDIFAADTSLWAVRSAGMASELFNLQLAGGGYTAISYGRTVPLRNVFDSEDPLPGMDPQDVAWLPSVRNPFTGDMGVLIATDAATDQLIYLDSRLGSANELYGIYISQASAGSSLSISTVLTTEDGEFLSPYTGVSEETPFSSPKSTTDGDYDLRFNSNGGSNPPNIKFTSNIGGVFIGARQWVLRTSSDTVPEPLLPLIDAAVAERIGVRAAGLNETGTIGTASAGLVLAPSLLDYYAGTSLGLSSPDMASRLVGANMDRVKGLAIRMNREHGLNFDPTAVVVVDTDGVDPQGNPVGLELGLMYADPTGAANNPLYLLPTSTLRSIFTIAGNPATRLTSPLTPVDYYTTTSAGVTSLLRYNPFTQLGEIIGAIKVDGADVTLSDFSFTADGHLLAIDTSGVSDRIIEINLTDPTQSTALTFKGLANSYDGQFVYTLIQNGGVAELWRASYQVQNTGPSFSPLTNYLAQATLTAATKVGNIANGAQNIENIEDLGISADGKLYVIGEEASTPGVQKLYLLNPSASGFTVALRATLDGTAGAVSAFAVSPSTGLGYAIRDQGGTDTLVTIHLATGHVVALDPIEVDGAATTIQSLQFTANGSALLAIDTAGAQPRLLKVDLTHPDQSTVVQTWTDMNADITEWAIGHTGQVFGLDSTANTILMAPLPQSNGSAHVQRALPINVIGLVNQTQLYGLAYGDAGFTGNEYLYAVIPSLSLIPAVSVGQMGAGIVGTVEGFALSRDNLIFYTLVNNGGFMQIWSTLMDDTGQLDATTTELRGTITYNAQTVNNVHDLAVSASGQVYCIGDDLADPGVQRLYRLDIDFLGAITATAVDLTGGVSGDVTAFAINPLTGEGYAMRDQGGTSTLVSINLATGVTTPIGVVQVPDDVTPDKVISALTFTNDGQTLIGLDLSGTPELVKINLTTSPTVSERLVTPTAWNASMTEMMMGQANRLYGLNDGAPLEVFISSAASNALGWINVAGIGAGTTSVDFNALADLSALPTAALTNSLPISTALTAFAFAPFRSSFGPQRALFVTDSLGKLYELEYTTETDSSNPAYGRITSVTAAHFMGMISDVVTQNTITDIGSMFFDATGRLLIQDRYRARLVDLPITQATGYGDQGSHWEISGWAGNVVATLDGSLRPTVGGIAYDATANEYLAIDNATSELDLGDNEGVWQSPLDANFPGQSPTLGRYPATMPVVLDESAVLMRLKGLTTATDQHQKMNSILIGGRVTGRVNLYGSVNTFYAGSILTGQTIGQIPDSPLIPANFYVAGDLRNLIVSGSIGTSEDPRNQEGSTPLLMPDYYTGADIVVDGQLGQLRALDAFAGTLRVKNLTSVTGFTSADFFGDVTEVENRQMFTGGQAEQLMETFAWNNFRLYAQDGRFNNDTYATPQYLGTIRNSDSSQADQIKVAGNLERTSTGADPADYYSVSLMAGQLVTVHLGEIFGQTPTIKLGVFDPDGRLIASNYSRSVIESDRVVFRADRPGNYRIVVGHSGDPTFTQQTWSGSSLPYDFTVEGVGTLALGAATAATTFMSAGYGVKVDRGDLGAIVADGSVLFTYASPTGTVVVNQGDLRVMEGNQIGELIGGAVSGWPTLLVPQGSVGLLRSNGGELQVETAEAIGGNFQIIQSAADASGIFIANGGIGTIRVAGTFGRANTFPVVTADADGQGNDGIIDLIDISGNMGSAAAGGAHISHGPGGNVRFMRVGGLLFQDSSLFTSGASLGIYFGAVGESMTFRDDGGATLEISPGWLPMLSLNGGQPRLDTNDPADLNPDFDFRKPESLDNPRYIWKGQLAVTTYGIHSGGVVVLDVTSTHGGVSINSRTNGVSAAAEVSSITLLDIHGSGRSVDVLTTPITGALVTGPFSSMLSGLQLNPTITGAGESVSSDINVRIFGNTRVDVLNVQGNVSVTNLINYTAGGQIIGVNLTSIGKLESKGSIGMADSRLNPYMQLAPQNLTISNYPFLGQHTAIISGNIIEIRADGAIGNVLVTGNIGWITADADRQSTQGGFEGIAAPIVVLPNSGSIAEAGAILNINIGQGIAPSGTGMLARAGLYANAIRNLNGTGDGRDIRGDVVVAGTTTFTNGGDGLFYGASRLGRISLAGGSIINANIGVFVDYLSSSPLINGALTGIFVQSDRFDQWSIGAIELSGTGGIIGSNIMAVSIRDVTVSGGFGLINSSLFTVQGGKIRNITVDGYGIRNTTIISSNQGIGNITATGRGQLLQDLSYSASVRQSAHADPANPLDSRFDEPLNASNDLHLAMGYARIVLTPGGTIENGDKFRVYVTDDRGRRTYFESAGTATTVAGVLSELVDNFNARYATDSILQNIQLINQGTFLLVMPTTPEAPTTPFDITLATINRSGGANTQTFTYAGNRQAGVIGGGTVVTTLGDAGDIRAYAIRGTGTAPIVINVGNQIKSITTLASVDTDPATLKDTTITAGGIGNFRPGGSLNNVTLNVSSNIAIDIRGDILGNSSITVGGENGSITSLRVSGDVFGNIRAAGRIIDARISGDLIGLFQADGSGVTRGNTIDSLSIGGSMIGGINVNGHVGTIRVAGSLTPRSETDAAKLKIDGNLGTLEVGTRGGTLDYLSLPVVVQGNLGNLTVNGAISGAYFQGNGVNRIGTLTPSGQPSGAIFVGGDLNNARISVDNNQAGGVLLSDDLVVGGTLGTLSVTNGSIGDGTNSLHITAGRRLQALTVTNGNIAQNATVGVVQGDLSSLRIQNGNLVGDVQAQAGTLGNLSLSGTGANLSGSIRARDISTISIGGSILASGVDIVTTGTLNQLSVTGNVAADAVIIAGEFRSLNVRGNLGGNIISSYGLNSATISVGGNWTLAGLSQLGQDASITVQGAMLGSQTLSFLRGLTSLRVTGNLQTDLLVNLAIGSISVGAMSGALITSGFDINSVSIAGVMANSLIQAGVSRGDDNVFALTLNDKDANETNRIADINSFRAGSMSQSLLAAAGTLKSFQATGLVSDSTILAGVALGSTNLAAALLDGTPLATAPERNNARADNGDLVLYRGNIDSISANRTAGWQNTVVAAGVNPGSDGSFSTPTVTDSVTGGASVIGTISGATDAASLFVTDAGITRNNVTGGIPGQFVRVNYALADVANSLGLETQLTPVGGVTSSVNGGVFVFTAANGNRVTFRLSGPGTLRVYDQAGSDTDNLINSITLENTTSSTRLQILTTTAAGAAAPGTVGIGRIITADDATIGTLTFDGSLGGHALAQHELWIDGAMSTLSLGGLLANAAGQIGGNVSNLSIVTQNASASLVIGGAVQSLVVTNSAGSPSMADLAAYSLGFNTLAQQPGGSVWGHRNGVIYAVNPAVTDTYAANRTIVDAATGQNVSADTLRALGYLGANLYAMGYLSDPNPAVEIAGLTQGQDINNLAARANTRNVVFTPGGVIEVGDIFRITIDDGQGATYQIQHIATATTVTNVTAGLKAAFDAAAVGNAFLSKLVATDNSTTLTLAIQDAYLGTPWNAVSSTVNRIGGQNSQALTSAVTTYDTVFAIRSSLDRSVITPGTVEVGDVFRITIDNGQGTSYLIQYTAAAATVADVTAGLKAAFDAAAVGNPLLAQITATDNQTSVTLRIGANLGTTWNVAVATQDGGGADTQTLANADVFKDQLVRLHSETGAVTVVGALRPVSDGVNTYGFYHNVLAMSFDNSGNLLAVVDNAHGQNPGLTTGIALVKINLTADANGNLLVSSPASAVFFGKVLTGLAGGETISALAVQADTGTIYGVSRTGANIDRLISINATTGAVTVIGAVEIDEDGPGATDIRDIGFDGQGNLVALDYNVGSPRLLLLTPGQLATPDSFQLVNATGFLPEDFTAFTITKGGSSRSYAFMNPLSSGTHLFGSAGDPEDAQGRALVLGQINTATGLFTRIASGVADIGGGDGVLSIGDLGTISIAPDNDDGDVLYVAAGNGNLYSIDVSDATPKFTLIGAFELANGTDVAVSQIAFDEDGNLVGIDAGGRRLVTIDPATARVSPQTGNGLLSGDLAGLVYDTNLGALLTFNDANNTFVTLNGEGGLTATRFGTVTTSTTASPGEYRGRLVSTGAATGSFRFNGAFSGVLEAAGNVSSITIGGANTSAITAGNGLNTLSITGNTAQSANIQVTGRLGSFTQRGLYSGNLTATAADSLNFTGTGTVADTILDGNASLTVTGAVKNLTVAGGFDGQASFGALTDSASFRGRYGANARLLVAGNANSITLATGADVGSQVIVSGSGSSFRADATFQGTAAYHYGLGSARFRDALSGLLDVGLDLGSLSVSGDAMNSVFSVGTWIGADGVYNTSDDRITGGKLRSATFSGRFSDSVLAAGVLPGLGTGSGLPADHRFYTGFNAAGGQLTDSAEAGGLSTTTIESVQFNGEIINTQPTGARKSVLVSAGAIGRVTTRIRDAVIAQRTYDDPIGAPTVSSIEASSDSSIRVVFSELVATGSLVVSTIAGDAGSVIVTQNGVILTGLSLAFSTRTSPTGQQQTVMTINSSTSLAGVVSVTLRGTAQSTPSDVALSRVVDRTGLRSTLRDPLAGDLPGTIIDGNDNGVEPGDYVALVNITDSPDSFPVQPNNLPDPTTVTIDLPLDGGQQFIAGNFSDIADSDVFHITATAGQFFSVKLDSVSAAELAVYYRDDQGTPELLSDDTFQLLTRIEANRYTFGPEMLPAGQPKTLLSAHQLPLSGDYYIVVAPVPITAGDVVTQPYTLTMSLASSDAALASSIRGSLDTATGQITLDDGSVHQIAYTNSADRQALGMAKQLVFINFTGGLSTKALGEVMTMPFSAEMVHSSLTGQTEALISQIMDYILEVYNTLPPAMMAEGPLAHLVDMSDPAQVAAYRNATSGLWFTVTNPATADGDLGLVNPDDYTTVFVGKNDATFPGLLGIASNIDVAGTAKNDEALIFAQNEIRYSLMTDVGTSILDNAAHVLSATIAHELGHTLGLNHQPTSFTPSFTDPSGLTGSWTLEYNGPNAGQNGLMAYAPALVDNLLVPRLGNAPMAEFLGHTNTAQLISWWFGPGTTIVEIV